MHILIKVDLPYMEERLAYAIYNDVRSEVQHIQHKFRIAMYRVDVIKLEKDIVTKEVLMKADDQH